MKAPKSTCCRTIDVSEIVVSERRSKACFSNPSRKSYCLVEVDKCEMKESSEIRCDYLLRADTWAKFIELKGKDVEHGVAQVKASMRYFTVTKDGSETVTALVISTQVPLMSPLIQKLKKEVKSEFGATLVLKNTPYRENLG